MNLLLRGGRLVTHEAVIKKDILVEGQAISRVAASINPEELPLEIRASMRTIDCEGLLIFPGFIDAHTHFGLGKGEGRTADGFFGGICFCAAAPSTRRRPRPRNRRRPGCRSN